LFPIGVKAETVHFLINHLILVQSVKVRCVPADNPHLIFITVGEVMVVTDDALQTRDTIPTRAIRHVVVWSVVLLVIVTWILIVVLHVLEELVFTLQFI
jgi:hypothetical protein